MRAVLTELLQDLRALLGARHVLTVDGDDRSELLVYERDWRKRYVGRALAVLLPADAAEVAAIVRRCAGVDGVSLVAQGGNTGLVGGGVPDASGTQIVVSLKRLRTVHRIDGDNQTITVGAGLLLQEVQQAAAGAGLLFPLSLAAEGSCTIGGNLATNAGGTQVLRFGNARELCLGLEVVTAAGEIWSNLDGLRKDNTGYDLRDLFIGSEGTLGLITAATLRLFPQARSSLTGWARCSTLARAVALMRRLRATFDAELIGFEAMNTDSIDLVQRHFPDMRLPLPMSPIDGRQTSNTRTGQRETSGSSPAGESAPILPWAVLFDLASSHAEASLRTSAESALVDAHAAGELDDVVIAQNATQSRALWHWRESIPLAQSAEGLNIKHDIGVPLSSLAEFVDVADHALRDVAPGARHITFGHLGDGNLHYNLQAPVGMPAADFLTTFEAAANRCVYDVVARFGGTFSAEHGIGRLKRAELAERKPAAAIAMMRSIKAGLDPRGLLNPDVLLPD